MNQACQDIIAKRTKGKVLDYLTFVSKFIGKQYRLGKMKGQTDEEAVDSAFDEFNKYFQRENEKLEIE